MRTRFLGPCLATLLLSVGPAREAECSVKARLDGIEVEITLAQPDLTTPRSDSVKELIFGARGRTDRLLIDSQARASFGYSLSAERISGSRKIRVTLVPLSGNGEERLRTLAAHADAWQHLCPGCPAPNELKAITPKPSQFPPAQVVDDGDTFLFEALANPTTGRKLVDVIRVSLTDEPPMTEAVLKVKDARLTVNGRALPTTAGCQGQIIYFVLKNRGRYLISAREREGFDTMAMLRNDTIEFSLNGVSFQWTSAEPIVRPPSAPADGKVSVVMPLWVKHEPDWKSAVFANLPEDAYGVGASDDPDRE